MTLSSWKLLLGSPCAKIALFWWSSKNGTRALCELFWEFSKCASFPAFSGMGFPRVDCCCYQWSWKRQSRACATETPPQELYDTPSFFLFVSVIVFCAFAALELELWDHYWQHHKTELVCTGNVAAGKFDIALQTSASMWYLARTNKSFTLQSSHMSWFLMVQLSDFFHEVYLCLKVVHLFQLKKATSIYLARD